VNFGFGQTTGSPALGDAQRFRHRCWIGLEESLALGPPAKTTDSLQTLIDRGGAQACDIHRVLAVAQYVGGREIRQSRLPAFYRRKPFEE
jgi:hypothetical protein